VSEREESDMEESITLTREPLLPQQQQQTPSSLINHLYIGHFLARWDARFFFHLSSLI